MTFVTLYIITKLNGVQMKSFTAVNAIEKADEFLQKTPPVGFLYAYAYDRDKQLLKQWG